MNQPKRTLTAERFFPDHTMLSINRATEAFRLPQHDHEFIELAYVGEGRGFHYMENEVRPAARGQLFVIPVGVSHVFRPSSPDTASEPLVVYNCIFQPGLIDSLLPVVTEEPIAAYMKELQTGKLSCEAITDVDACLEALFLAMHREHELPQSGASTYLRSLLLQLLLTMHRLKHRESSEWPGKHDRFIQVLEYVERHYSEELTLSQLTESFRWSERQLQRLFKRHTSQTFLHYLQGVRVRKSCEQLRKSDRTIGAIAESVGYRDVNSFIALFKKVVGQTPGSYRKQQLFT
ncbi:AraC family transcriptional regulator, L-rhamnose operon transcriptional activator RhaR [Paenibacillus sp. UNCCL117]|uniref:AraC family transcriptional regulator n=1 Tax=unclassified Paenibacillus TaxID=185978 RepID=UPI000883EFFD|nr:MULTISPECIES: AraC family transcriptional regulator [unclassified Paenibacillus]SDD04841.1 AraC family transcriptional regulator, L-rhamnose operon transcriptional activator RhaR [Paenibacillus sp. cl123]SFW31992.1 AraC family transcriptional regulator, L-rhamnose operon transcriptional activator RhaR [Paenibacillus sp. UNCCL117]